MNKNSIIKKVTIKIVIPLFLQSLLFGMLLLSVAVIPVLKVNTLIRFKNKGNDKHIYIQNQVMHNWSSINAEAKSINSAILNSLEKKGISTTELNSNASLSDEILMEISPSILYLGRETYSTDIFLVLDTKGEGEEKTGYTRKKGIYIKDIDPITISKNNSDLYIERGSMEIANQLEIKTNSNWRSEYLLNKDDPNNDFFYKPINEARKQNDIEDKSLGHWSKPSIITDENVKLITYSIPLIDSEGNPYGVLGVGINSNYIKEIFKDDGLNEGYEYDIVVEDNEIYKDHFKIDDITNIDNINKELLNKYKNSNIEVKSVFDNVYRLTSEEDKVTYAFRKEINLYRSDNQASNEKWYMTAVVESDEIFSNVNEFKVFMHIFIVGATLIGMLISSISVRNVTKPIRALAEKVRQSNPRVPLKLEKINISEIDELALAITNLSTNVAYEASKLNKIIDILHIPLGAFKHIKGEGSVYCTSGLFEILGVERIYKKAEYIDLDSFKLIIKEATKIKYEDEEDVYIIKKENQEDRWIRFIIQEEEIGTFGVITDVTKEILEKIKIEYERDHDVLTDLLNRRAFRRIAQSKMDKGDAKIAAFIMWDLDNLKFINDTYGHEYGDEYIRQAANILKEFERYNGLVARISGDEFLVFMYGYDSKYEIMDKAKEIQDTMKNTIFDFPYYHYNKIKIRASVGIAWYPEDASSYDVLVKYADFAMYKIKNTVKGSIAEFDKDEYNKSSFLIDKKEDFNRLIDEQLVYYIFHPIVDAHTGAIYAYEILMRSKLESLKSPYQILAIAASESKLHEIEKLTWFKGFEAIEEYNEELGDAKIFINSIPNHILFEEDLEELVGKYEKHFPRIVVELLENERFNLNNILEKKKQIEKYDVKIAIDDFGSGYNNEAVLLEITPDFVKVDMEIVRGIHKDLDRQDIIKNLLSYTTKRGIKMIAEGVETREELEKLIELGVDYVQGYYISRPEANPPKIRKDLVREILDINKKQVL